MNLKEIKDLLKAVSQSEIDELEIEQGDEKISIRRNRPQPAQENSASAAPPYVVVASGLPSGNVPQAESPPQPPAVAAPPTAASKAEAKPEAEEEADEDLIMVTSPMVGTFYESPSPTSPAFVQVGDQISAGQVLCIIEAMKLMNEIEAEAGGVVVKRFVNNAQPVEFGEALYALRPA